MSQRKLPIPNSISKDLIDGVCERLSKGKLIRTPLPRNGFLHIDRKLPFLCVYRRPPKRRDEGTERLVTAEASCLVASGSRHLKPGLTALIQHIVMALADEFKAFLIIEIWSSTQRTTNSRPRFRIAAAKIRPPVMTIKALENALKEIKILKKSASVEIVYEQNRWPKDMPPLVPLREIRKLNYYIIGLEVGPVFQDPDTGELFPQILRRLQQGLAQALKRAFFEFSYTQTTHCVPNFHALGAQKIPKGVWEADRRLAEIGNAFDFLLQVTPINIDRAWNLFEQRNCERKPVLFYRPLPFDIDILKRKLYEIPLENVEDPTLSYLFREKRIELDRQLVMLRDLDTVDFLYGSMQLFGHIDAQLLRQAIEILETISARSREENSGERLNAGQFAKRARQEIDYYRAVYPALEASVQVRDDTVGLMVSKGNLLIGQRTSIPASRVAPLLQHELGTHMITYYNGLAQPFHQLHTGLAGYDELQEGLAVLSEYLVGGLSRPRLRLLAGRVAAANSLIGGADFVETFRELNRDHGFRKETAFTITVRIYRGGGLTKDAVYLRGLFTVLNYIKDGGDLEPLFVGKIAANHIPVINELQSRGILRPVPLRPRYMDYPQTAQRLAGLKNGISIFDLTNPLET